MDWEIATKELNKKLDPMDVKSRKQGKGNVQYIEGWKAIAEANRVFGFNGWTRETMSFSCVVEKPRKIGKEQAPGFGVTYIAKVLVTVDGVAREGCGAGHGILKDLGEAHESALKEAETDAMKRALMTFGNPFGLALYDKARENVGVNPTPAQEAKEDANAIGKQISEFTDSQKLEDWWRSDATIARRGEIAKHSDKAPESLLKAYGEQLTKLEGPAL